MNDDNSRCVCCGRKMPSPNRAYVYYMHDNHTFTRIGGTLQDILNKAHQLGRDFPYGMLCPVILVRNNLEIRRVGPYVHSRADGLSVSGTAKWEAAIMNDPDAKRLLTGEGGDMNEHQDQIESIIARAIQAGYEPGDGTITGAMLIDGVWHEPRAGCDSLQVIVDRLRAEFEQLPRVDA